MHTTRAHVPPPLPPNPRSPALSVSLLPAVSRARTSALSRPPSVLECVLYRSFVHNRPVQCFKDQVFACFCFCVSLSVSGSGSIFVSISASASASFTLSPSLSLSLSLSLSVPLPLPLPLPLPVFVSVFVSVNININTGWQRNHRDSSCDSSAKEPHFSRALLPKSPISIQLFNLRALFQ